MSWRIKLSDNVFILFVLPQKLKNEGFIQRFSWVLKAVWGCLFVIFLILKSWGEQLFLDWFQCRCFWYVWVELKGSGLAHSAHFSLMPALLWHPAATGVFSAFLCLWFSLIVSVLDLFFWRICESIEKQQRSCEYVETSHLWTTRLHL